MARPPIAIDKDKLRAALRTLAPQYAFHMLFDAVDLLPPAKLHKLAGKYLDAKSFHPDGDGGKGAEANLLEDVRAFEKASRAGEYYESFDVNSKNYMEQSTGTTAWIAEYRRLLDRCAVEAKKGDPGEMCAAFDVLFGLLDYIDECNDDVVFFADEGGSWQVGVDWKRVLPSWFKVLSATAAPGEYAERIDSVLKRHYSYGRDKVLIVARKTATPDQRLALAALTDRQARGKS
jgi:hypothetical protein